MESIISNCELKKTEKLSNVKVRGKVVRLVKEVYLRNDIECHSLLCPHISQETNDKSNICYNSITNRVGGLPIAVTHYIIPCYDVIKKYLEIFELPEIKGLIFAQTSVTRILQDVGKRHYNRILKLVRDGRKESTLFLNEINWESYEKRESGESLLDWTNKLTYKTALWYINHLRGLMPLVLVTEDDQLVKSLSNETKNIFVIEIKEYLQKFWTDLKPAFQLLESISFDIGIGNDNSIKSQEKLYPSHLSQELLSVGIKCGRYFQGKLHVNKYNSQEEASISRLGKDTEDIMIIGSKNRNRSIAGDEVVVELLSDSEIHSKGISENENFVYGRVVGIMQRKWRDYVAVIQEDENVNRNRKGGNYVLVIPYDYCIPKIRICTARAQELQDQRIVVRIDAWEQNSNYPQGHFVKSLGKIHDLETEVAALLVEHGISITKFSDGLDAELPKDTPENPWIMKDDEIKSRRDLSQTHLVYSIDPEGCEDVDDTLSIRKLSNGNTELGVHIADVTYFVAPHSLTDSEGMTRATTVYLVDRRYDMLPPVLSSNLCSLISGTKRFAVSVIWELNEKNEVVDVWFGRTVICSSYKLSYQVAHMILEDKPFELLFPMIPELQNLPKVERISRCENLKSSLESLTLIGRSLKAQRQQKGAVELDSVEVQFEFDQLKTKQMEAPKPKEHLEIHETVAECMIFANHWVAKRIYQSFPHQSILRHHPPPKQNFLQELRLDAASRGYKLNTASNKDLANSLNLAVNPSDPNVNIILRVLATRAMSEAHYISTGSFSTDQYYHYGLGLEKYTHFTSPIRRYADIIVHRLLLHSINHQPTNDVLKNEQLQELCFHVNERHRAAQNIQKDSSKLYQVEYFKNFPMEDEHLKLEGVVYSIRKKGLLILVPDYGMRGSLNLCNKENLVAVLSNNKTQWSPGQLIKEDRQIIIESNDYRQTYALFDHLIVKVNIEESRAHAARITFELLSCKKQETTSCPNMKILSKNKFDFVSEVKSKMIESESECFAKEEEEENNLNNRKKIKKPSLYEMILSMKEMSLKG